MIEFYEGSKRLMKSCYGCIILSKTIYMIHFLNFPPLSLYARPPIYFIYISRLHEHYIYFVLLHDSTFFSHFGLHDCLSAPRPECVSDPECPNHLACIQEKCQNPCFTHSCGQNAECKVKNHRALCVCLYGYVGDPYSLCEERKINFVPLRAYEANK